MVVANSEAGTRRQQGGNAGILDGLHTASMSWDDVDPTRLYETVRARGPAPDAERMVWAFERALAAARVDDELLDHLLVAAASLIAWRDGTTPRDVLEQVFRRSVGDDEWRERYAPLLVS
jgi:hypothetical protein